MNTLRALIRAFQSRLVIWRHPNLSRAFSVPSHLTVRERTQLYYFARLKNSIAEIGSYVGASACCFGAAAEKFGVKKIICIDTWNNDAMSEGHRETWADFTKNTETYSKFLFPIRGYSTEVVEKVKKIIPVLDLLFIDGDHSYEGVKADWEAYKTLLAPGAIVVFHDYGWAEGVKRVVHEDVIPLVSKHSRLPNMWWGTLAKSV